MLRTANDLMGYNVVARDGECGQVVDILFDDLQWTMRYLVVDTGDWLPGRKVLLPTGVLGEPNWAGSFFLVELDRDQIENMPPVAWDEPVGRRHEKELLRRLQVRPYWISGPVAHPIPVVAGADSESNDTSDKEDSGDMGDPNLRSWHEVRGYHIKAADGEIGHIEDLLLEDDRWVIRYGIVDTANWLPGRKVLVATTWFNGANWKEAWLSTDLSQEEIRQSPEYDRMTPLSRNYEGILHDHYGRAKYWP